MTEVVPVSQSVSARCWRGRSDIVAVCGTRWKGLKQRSALWSAGIGGMKRFKAGLSNEVMRLVREAFCVAISLLQ
jgi:hypothetical protein